MGRRRELDALLSGLADALEGRGGLFLLAGEPGIGKSRLADELSELARERGATVLWGRCWEAGGAPAYWPWVQSLRSLIRVVEPSDLRSLVSTGGADLAQMLPEVRETLPDLPEVPPSLDPRSARFRLFDATASFLRAAAERRPIVLVLDDLHAADESSLLLLEFLAAQVDEMPVLVMGTYRDVDPTIAEPLASTLTQIARGAKTRGLHLSGLAPGEVAALIEAVTGSEPSDDFVAAIVDETEGNPLFIGEMVRLLAAEDLLDGAGGGAGRPLGVPVGIREVIGRRLARLSDECRRVLSVASVIGREFEPDVLAQAVGRDAGDLASLLDEASAVRAIGRVPGAQERLRFDHALIREALYGELDPPQRADLHHEIAGLLEEAEGEDPGPRLAEIAHHYALSGRDAGKAVEYGWLAGDRASRLLAFEEAVRRYRVALNALDTDLTADLRTRCELLLRMGDAQMKAGDGPGSKATFLTAAAIARGTWPEGLARAALGYGGRFVWLRAGPDHRLVPLLEEAVEAIGEEPSPTRVRLLARLACALRDEPDVRRRDELSANAVAMARGLHHPPTLAYALAGRYAAVWGPDNTRELLEIADEAVRLGKIARDPEREIEGHLVRHTALTILGDMQAAKAALDDAERLATDLKQVMQRWYVSSYRAVLALFEGRFDAAEVLVAETLDIGRRADELDPQVAFHLQTFALRRTRGQLEETLGVLRRSVDDYPWYPLFRCVLALAQVELGRKGEARHALEDLAADGFASIPRDNQWLMAMSVLAEVAGALEDREQSETLFTLLEPYAGLNALFAPEISAGSLARAVAIAAAVAGRWEDAVRHGSAAIAANDRMGARPWAARARLETARALTARGLPGDRDRARELAAEAREAADELGMPPLASAADVFLEVDGAPRPVAASVFRKEGDDWAIAFDGDAFRLKDTKGLRYLAYLLGRPGAEVHVLDLVAAEGGAAARGASRAAAQEGLEVASDDAGEVLDLRARRAYRERVEELRQEIEEADAYHDLERAARAREEMEYVAAELGRA
ncbi:MAG TPA: AAA family ATPase, partial [Actinomycetota bacterium]|nr:AAA family ATPase [Actinomycetota bacterium]